MKLLKSLVVFMAMVIGLSAFAAAEVKEWNFLVYLNGKNNLDSFGTLNLNQMEQYGSDANRNILVQWGSTKNKTTKRLLIQKEATNSNTVTSPVVADMGKVDMGDYRSLVDFAKWAQDNYPSRHTFIAVWNHGSGWHLERDGEVVRDISWDDETGNHITTEQLGLAMGEIAKLYGRKIDIYGSDACLMAMPEVASEMMDSVDVFVGSEDVEPGEGWPYHTFLNRWTAEPTADAEHVSSMLTEEYAKAYNGGVYGKRTASLSSFRLSTITLLQSAVSGLSQMIQSLPADAKAKVKSAVSASQYFTYSDYRDMGDFISNLEKAQITEINSDTRELATLKAAISKFVISNYTTAGFEKAKGVSFWFPTSQYTLSTHGKRYKGLAFDKATNWSAALESLLK